MRFVQNLIKVIEGRVCGLDSVNPPPPLEQSAISGDVGFDFGTSFTNSSSKTGPVQLRIKASGNTRHSLLSPKGKTIL